MKKLLAIVTIAVFTACGGGSSEEGNSAASGDSMTKATDSAMLTGDTSAMNGNMGDSSSASGIHGAGSGSRVGGGETGKPQGEAARRR